MPPLSQLVPNWLQSNNVGGLQAFQKQLPGLFNTKPLDTAYGNAIGDMQTQGRAMAAAAGARYANSAMQSGASTQGAGFAEGQAMLPVYAQGSQMLADLAGRKLQSNTAYAGAMGDIGGRIGQLLGQHQSTMAGYMGDQQRTGMQNQQFNSDLGFRRAQLAQMGQQFDTTFGEGQRQFNLNYGLQSGRAPVAGAGGGGGGMGFSGMVTRAPNTAGTGPIEYTPQFTDYLRTMGASGNAMVNAGAMQYPQTAGIGSGQNLDAYERMQRILGSVATPQVPEYNQGLKDIYSMGWNNTRRTA